MHGRKAFRRGELGAVLAWVAWVLSVAVQAALGQAPDRAASGASAGQSAPGSTRPGIAAYRLAERVGVPAPHAGIAALQPGDPNEHPLMPALRWARSGVGNIEKIADYSATLFKRERIDGKLGEQEVLFLKIRHRPFSVYLRFDGPPSQKGQEVLYIDGANDGKMWAHGVGVQRTLFKTVSLKPDGAIAMQGERYPITEIGMLNLTQRMIEVGEEDIKYGECEVKFFKGAKINDRTCTCTQLIHPVPRRNFLYHLARIFIDDELNLPIRYESYDWPKREGDAPELLEEYTYTNVRLNNNFKDIDFDVHNPRYRFP
jgi:hypothetical protein